MDCYPGLDDLDYFTLNSPDTGIHFYHVMALLPLEMKTALMNPELKSEFVVKGMYAFDDKHDWGNSYVLQQLKEFKPKSGFSDGEFQILLETIEKVSGKKLPFRERRNNVQVPHGAKPYGTSWEEAYPGLDIIDYASLEAPNMGIRYYQTIVQLPHYVAVKCMEPEIKKKFLECTVRVNYTSIAIIMQDLKEFQEFADFDDDEFEKIVVAIGKAWREMLRTRRALNTAGEFMSRIFSAAA